MFQLINLCQVRHLDLYKHFLIEYSQPRIVIILHFYFIAIFFKAAIYTFYIVKLKTKKKTIIKLNISRIHIYVQHIEKLYDVILLIKHYLNIPTINENTAIQHNDCYKCHP